MSSQDGAYFLPVQKTPYLANDPTIGQYINKPNPFLFLLPYAGVDRKKFLTSQEAATIVFPSGRAQGHRNIFLRSIEAMSKTLERNIYGLRYPGFSIDKLDIPSPDPLTSVRYSCVFWIDHLCEAPNKYSQSQGDLRDSGPVHRFLEGYLLYWIEASSLSGAMFDIVYTIGSLERLLKCPASLAYFH
ncbi:hypothetical protein FOXG_19479 [Fusarium oxysporum f. sp. lycopersici 4287]|uniref:Uncharacterized protein n=1 Tax=Fusarium oxysporum f. sp. lycopersici (strain 4287 / CBS 123668 / FGSC 9935 / NRRL 34936) TaxID=426428 RepID=A0A0J9V0D5_FUSO4|nr:hypothetical protein FOXG_19479 [Fusarium oxysporum f. sp. lycopersici 4287]KNB05024.1 hypothetical protein FOXG_19479 [Fusarium oxysporum f. sp. lycopersici 4287]